MFDFVRAILRIPAAERRREKRPPASSKRPEGENLGTDIRPGIRDRPTHACERCHRPDRKLVVVVNRAGLQYWRTVDGRLWRDEYGRRELDDPANDAEPWLMEVVVSVVRLNRTQESGDHSFKALCQYCQLVCNPEGHPEYSGPFSSGEKRALNSSRGLNTFRPSIPGTDVEQSRVAVLSMAEQRKHLVELCHGMARDTRDVVAEFRLTRTEAAVLVDLEEITLRRPLKQGGPIAVRQICKMERSRALGMDSSYYCKVFRRLQDLGIVQRHDRRNPGAVGTFSLVRRAKKSQLRELAFGGTEIPGTTKTPD